MLRVILPPPLAHLSHGASKRRPTGVLGSPRSLHAYAQARAYSYPGKHNWCSPQATNRAAKAQIVLQQHK